MNMYLVQAIFTIVIIGIITLTRKKQTVASPETPSLRGKEVGWFDGLFAERKEEEKSNFGKWWSKKKAEQKLWFMYTATAVLGILIAILTPEKYAEYRYAIAGIFILLVLHLVIWPFYTEKTSSVSKIVISGFLIFYPLAWLLPDIVTIRDNGMSVVKTAAKNTAARTTTLAKNYKDGKTDEVDTEMAVKSIPITVGSDIPTEVVVPAGYRFSSAQCPPDAVMVIEGPNVPDGQMPIDCAGSTNLPSTTFEGARIGFHAKEGVSQTTVTVWYVKV